MDREKVIHAVETAFELWIDEYTGCSWFKEDEVRQAKEDAIALLKEQESVKPIYTGFNMPVSILFRFECKCGAPVMEDQPFCMKCGKQIDWEGRRSGNDATDVR